MELYFQTFPEGADISQFTSPPIVIIPGLFGSTANWRRVAKTLGERFPVVVIDQRNHGRSPHADSNNYHDMAADLLEFSMRHGFEKIIPCGHSMGGKTAMMFSLLQPERVERLLVLDIAPVSYSHSHAPFLEELLKVDLSQLQSRSAADRALQEAIPDNGTRLFLLQSLSGKPSNYRWRLNLEVLSREMATIVGFPRGELEGKVNTVETLFIYGESSSYLQAEHYAQIRNFFPNTAFEGIANAGHWLHVEQPQAVIASIINFLEKSEIND